MAIVLKHGVDFLRQLQQREVFCAVWLDLRRQIHQGAHGVFTQVGKAVQGGEAVWVQAPRCHSPMHEPIAPAIRQCVVDEARDIMHVPVFALSVRIRSRSQWRPKGGQFQVKTDGLRVILEQHGLAVVCQGPDRNRLAKSAVNHGQLLHPASPCDRADDLLTARLRCRDCA